MPLLANGFSLPLTFGVSAALLTPAVWLLRRMGHLTRNTHHGLMPSAARGEGSGLRIP